MGKETTQKTWEETWTEVITKLIEKINDGKLDPQCILGDAADIMKDILGLKYRIDAEKVMEKYLDIDKFRDMYTDDPAWALMLREEADKTYIYVTKWKGLTRQAMEETFTEPEVFKVGI